MRITQWEIDVLLKPIPLVAIRQSGARTIRQNTTGFQNVAVGHGTLNSNVAGSVFNEALGKSALALNTGDGNTAIGNVALLTTQASTTQSLGNVAGTN